MSTSSRFMREFEEFMQSMIRRQRTHESQHSRPSRRAMDGVEVRTLETAPIPTRHNQRGRAWSWPSADAETATASSRVGLFDSERTAFTSTPAPAEAQLQSQTDLDGHAARDESEDELNEEGVHGEGEGHWETLTIADESDESDSDDDYDANDFIPTYAADDHDSAHADNDGRTYRRSLTPILEVTEPSPPRPTHFSENWWQAFAPPRASATSASRRPQSPRAVAPVPSESRPGALPDADIPERHSAPTELDDEEGTTPPPALSQRRNALSVPTTLSRPTFTPVLDNATAQSAPATCAQRRRSALSDHDIFEPHNTSPSSPPLSPRSMPQNMRHSALSASDVFDPDLSSLDGSPLVAMRTNSTTSGNTPPRRPSEQEGVPPLDAFSFPDFDSASDDGEIETERAGLAPLERVDHLSPMQSVRLETQEGVFVRDFQREHDARCAALARRLVETGEPAPQGVRVAGAEIGVGVKRGSWWRRVLGFEGSAGVAKVGGDGVLVAVAEVDGGRKGGEKVRMKGFKRLLKKIVKGRPRIRIVWEEWD